jgi:5'-nucleotidase
MSDAAKLHVLITCDDGVHAPALDLLAARLDAAGHAVQVVAPAVEHSGCGASLGPMRDGLVIAAKQVSLPRTGIVATAVDAPPALGVLAGCQGLFGSRPDVVVSGINSGFNTGPMVLHSGTLGAAMTAAAHGIPAIALSTERNAVHGFAAAAEFCARWLEPMTRLAAELSATNVNVPDLPFDEFAGVRATTLGRHSLVSIAITPDQDGLRLHRNRSAKPLAAETDVETVRDGYVSVTTVYAGVHDLPAEESPWLS